MIHRIYLLAIAGALSFAIQAQEIETPTMGWSSWNTYRVNISDRLIRKQADAMKEKGLGEVGYKYINIDDGYFGGRDEDGNLLTHPRRFPDGLKPVVDHIHQLGFKAGIYSDAGCNTCGHFWDKDEAGQGVGLYGHDRQDADFFFNRLGFDFIKIDFCGGDARQNTLQLGLDERTRYTQIREAIDATGRKDVRINVCRWAFPGTWVYGVGSSWRMSPDISVNWNVIKNIIEKNMYLSAYAGDGHYNDMDMLEVGRGLGPVVDLTHFGMWCIMSSPLLIGCDMTAISDSTLHLLKNKELIGLNQDRLGLQAYVAARKGNAYVLVKDIEQIMGKKRAFAVYNAGDTPATVTVDMGEHLNLAGKIRLRDAGNQCDAGVVKGGSFSVTLPGRGSVFYVATAQKRLERTVYEAEDAWLEKYNAIEVKEENALVDIARVVTREHCSGGKAVARLGGKGNWMEWRRVYSRKGGAYRLTLKYISEAPLSARLVVNGKSYPLTDMDSKGVVAGKSIEVELKRGVNVIRLENEEGGMPDMDCMEVSKEFPKLPAL